MKPTVNKLLIVKLSSLGDIVQAMPMIDEVQHQWPASTVDWLVFGRHRAILETHPTLGEIIETPKKTTWHSLLFLARLRARHYDAVLILHRHWVFSLFFWLTGIPHRLGFANKLDGLLTHRVSYDLAVHRLDRFRALLATIVPGSDAVARPLSVRPLSASPKGETGVIDAIMVSPFGCKNAESEMPHRRWPHYRRLIEQLHVRYPDTGITLIGNADDQAQIVAAGLDQLPGVTSKAGQLAIPALIDEMQQHGVFIGNDSFPLFLAARLGLQTIGLFGPTDGTLIMPREANCHIIQSDMDPWYDPTQYDAVPDDETWANCIARITPDTVLAKVQEVRDD